MVDFGSAVVIDADTHALARALSSSVVKLGPRGFLLDFELCAFGCLDRFDIEHRLRLFRNVGAVNGNWLRDVGSRGTA